jgi:DNA-binding NtrC family response regulator
MISVLIAHDEWEVRELLEAFLRHSGYYVVTAPTADAALSMMDERPCPTVVMIGVHLRCWRDGPLLADRLRQLYPTTATILITDEGAGSPVTHLPYGVVSCLLKPLEREGVLRAVEDGIQWASVEKQKASAIFGGQQPLPQSGEDTPGACSSFGSNGADAGAAGEPGSIIVRDDV